MGRNEWVVFALCCASVALAFTVSGCAVVQPECSRGYEYRAGACQGFGAGFSWHVITPEQSWVLARSGR